MDPPMETRILLIGLDGVGKSTIVTKLRDFKVNNIQYNDNLERRNNRNISNPFYKDTHCKI